MTTMTITEILCDIQSRLKAPKAQENKFGGYKYRSLEDIQEALKPLLAEHKAAVMLNDTIVQIGERIYIRAEATLMVGADEVSATAYAREPAEKKGMDASQITGAASSYARKYAMNGLFAIDDTKDADATNDHGKEEAAAPAPAKPRKVATLSDDQLENVRSAIMAAGMDEARIANFLKWCGVARDAEIPAAKYEMVMKQLGKLVSAEVQP